MLLMFFQYKRKFTDVIPRMFSNLNVTDRIMCNSELSVRIKQEPLELSKILNVESFGCLL